MFALPMVAQILKVLAQPGGSASRFAHVSSTLQHTAQLTAARRRLQPRLSAALQDRQELHMMHMLYGRSSPGRTELLTHLVNTAAQLC